MSNTQPGAFWVCWPQIPPQHHCQKESTHCELRALVCFSGLRSTPNHVQTLYRNVIGSPSISQHWNPTVLVFLLPSLLAFAHLATADQIHRRLSALKTFRHGFRRSPKENKWLALTSPPQTTTLRFCNLLWLLWQLY